MDSGRFYHTYHKINLILSCYIRSDLKVVTKACLGYDMFFVTNRSLVLAFNVHRRPLAEVVYKQGFIKVSKQSYVVSSPAS